MSTLNRFTNYTQANKYPKAYNPIPTKEKMSFWHGVDTSSVQPSNNGFPDSEDELEYNTDDEREAKVAIQSQHKRKAVDTLEPTIDNIKRIAIGDDEMTKSS